LLRGERHANCRVSCVELHDFRAPPLSVLVMDIDARNSLSMCSFVAL
jgi:hypothetical protein